MTARAAISVVGMGGAIRPGSTSEKAFHWLMAALDERGVATSVFTGLDLDFPLFNPNGGASPDRRLDRFLAAIRHCDALVISSPVYHGGPSGLVKNAIDHLQPLANDDRPYLTGRPVCCVAAGGGLPGAISTLSALRDVVHALRGWPTPMQVPINSSSHPFDEQGSCSDTKLDHTLTAALDDLLGFAKAMHSSQVLAVRRPAMEPPKIMVVGSYNRDATLVVNRFPQPERRSPPEDQ
ncbi:NADPH-dependent FMN reductase [Sphingomonas bacterium]|uniref:NADPH-dependent FMN reductase n=1 Tax=Sphingomonas bacterium TaxID=1895847 RepID=UPI00157621A3|nr:NADPH-dependent FMN reductase [Sphingomonas bacterium]